MATYRVFYVYYHGKPEYEAIFVETHENGTVSGHLYHVTGNILMGMTYEHKRARRPEDSAEFHEKRYIGRVKRFDYARVEPIYRGIAVLGRQLDLKGSAAIISGVTPGTLATACALPDVSALIKVAKVDG